MPADPLSITVASVSLLSGIVTLSKQLTSLITTVRVAKKDAEGFSHELASLELAVYRLRENEIHIPQIVKNDVAPILQQCKSVTDDMQRLVRQDLDGGAARRLVWTFRDSEELWKSRQRLESHKAGLQIAPSTAIIHQNNALKADTNAIRAASAASAGELAALRHEVSRLRRALENAPNPMLQRYLCQASEYAESLCDPFEELDVSSSSSGPTVVAESPYPTIRPSDFTQGTLQSRLPETSGRLEFSQNTSEGSTGVLGPATKDAAPGSILIIANPHDDHYDSFLIFYAHLTEIRNQEEVVRKRINKLDIIRHPEYSYGDFVAPHIDTKHFLSYADMQIENAPARPPTQSDFQQYTVVVALGGHDLEETHWARMVPQCNARTLWEQVCTQNQDSRKVARLILLDRKMWRWRTLEQEESERRMLMSIISIWRKKEPSEISGRRAVDDKSDQIGNFAERFLEDQFGLVEQEDGWTLREGARPSDGVSQPYIYTRWD